MTRWAFGTATTPGRRSPGEYREDPLRGLRQTEELGDLRHRGRGFVRPDEGEEGGGRPEIVRLERPRALHRPEAVGCHPSEHDGVEGEPGLAGDPYVEPLERRGRRLREREDGEVDEVAGRAVDEHRGRSVEEAERHDPVDQAGIPRRPESSPTRPGRSVRDRPAEGRDSPVGYCPAGGGWRAMGRAAPRAGSTCAGRGRFAPRSDTSSTPR